MVEKERNNVWERTPEQHSGGAASQRDSAGRSETPVGGSGINPFGPVLERRRAAYEWLSNFNPD